MSFLSLSSYPTHLSVTLSYLHAPQHKNRKKKKKVCTIISGSIFSVLFQVDDCFHLICLWLWLSCGVTLRFALSKVAFCFSAVVCSTGVLSGFVFDYIIVPCFLKERVLGFFCVSMSAFSG